MAYKRYIISGWVLILLLSLIMVFTNNVKAAKGYNDEFRDDTGQIIKLTRYPDRIVSLAPNMTEILFAIGVGKRMVGVTDFCDYPKEAKKLPRVGGGQIQTEAVLALRPDLVVANADIQPGIIKQLRKLGITVAAFRPNNWSTVLHTIKTLGKITGARSAAFGLIHGMEAKRFHVLQRKHSLTRVRVFIEVWNKPLMTAGPGTFLHEMILMAGGDDIASELKRPWAVIPAEEVLKKDPQLIILTCKNKRELLQRPGWERVTAVRRGMVYEVDPDVFSRPGPRLAKALETLSMLISKTEVVNRRIKGEKS